MSVVYSFFKPWLKQLVCSFFNRLLDREQVGDEEASLDDEEEDGFLKAFKVLFVFIL